MAGEDVSSCNLTFKYRLLPTKAQHRALGCVLEEQRQLYNAALEERIGCYRKTGKSLSYVDQCKSIVEWRRADETAAETPANLQRWTLRRVDEAYRGFYRRAAARNGRAGFPRFRGKGWWSSFGFNELPGMKFDGKRIRFSTMPGGLRVHLHRPLPAGKVLGCVFKKDAKGWHVCFQIKQPCSAKRAPDKKVGIDVGLTNLATLSDGSAIPNPRYAKRAQAELRRRQRALARCKKGSSGRSRARSRVEKVHRKIADARSTHLHQVSSRLVSDFDLIAVEKLNVKGLASGRVARSVNDVGWARLRQFLTYKAVRAGAQVIEVNPRNTSQACSGCGVIVTKTIAKRTHECAACGTVLDRDHNAALNILRLAVVGQGALNVAGCGERALRNITCEGISK